MRANLDVRTGAPEMWETVARAGIQLSEVGMGFLEKVQRARETIKESEEKAKIDTLGTSLLATLRTTGDPQARVKLVQEYQKGVMAIPTGPQTTAYANDANTAMSGRALMFDTDLKIAEAKDKYLRLAESYEENLSAENEAVYKDLNAGAADANLITKDEAVTRNQRWPIRARLATARRLARQGNILEAQVLLDEAKRLNPSADELKFADEIASAAQREEAHLAAKLDNALAEKMTAADKAKLGPMELLGIRTELEGIVSASPLREAEKRKRTKYIGAWYRGEGESDWNRILVLEREIDTVLFSRGPMTTIETEVGKAHQEGALGRINAEGATRRNDMLRRLRGGSVANNWNMAEAAGRELEDWIEGKSNAGQIMVLYNDAARKLLGDNPNWTPLQAYQGCRDLGTSYRQMPRAESERRLGEVMAGISAAPTSRPGAKEKPSEAIPPPDQRKVGKVYEFPNGRKGIWRGTGWEVVP